jgi:hypothetical protein
MSLFNDEDLADQARAKAEYRLIGVTTKLSPQEVEDIERLAKKYGPQRSEFIRQLILDELARGSGEPTVSTELTEIIGLRLMLTNLLGRLWTSMFFFPRLHPRCSGLRFRSVRPPPVTSPTAVLSVAVCAEGRLQGRSGDFETRRRARGRPGWRSPVSRKP